MNISGRIFLLGLALTICNQSKAIEIEYSYNTDNRESITYGYDKKEEYDVAIKICDPALTGSRILGMKFSIACDPEVVDNCSVWLSSELRLERINGKNTNIPDICQTEFIPETREISVSFSEPYTIPEEGVFAGYSLNVISTENGGNRPIELVNGNNPYGLYLHSSRSQLEWKSMATLLQKESPVIILIEGDFYPDAATPSFPDYTEVAAGDRYPMKVKIFNYGTAPVQNISYTYSIGEYHESGEYSFDTEIPSIFRASKDVEIPVMIPEKSGPYNFSFTLDKVNGLPNKTIITGATGVLQVYPFIPTYRPLIEEYTGLWCQWCPGGMVAMEMLQDEYPDNFIGLAYHYNDPMYIIPDSSFPNIPSGYPAIYVDRTESVNPLMFPNEYASYLNKNTIADINVDLNWTDDSHTLLYATSTVRFLKSITDARYKIAYILLADNLTNPDWYQSNIFSGMSSQEYSGSYWEPFITGESEISGLTYNNVVAYGHDIKGVDASLPSEIMECEVYTQDYFIDIEDIKNIEGIQFSQLSTTTPNYRMIAVLLDCTTPQPLVMNCNTSPTVEGTASVNSSEDSRYTVKTIYFDMLGNPVSHPQNGIFIKTEIMNDGFVKSVKIRK